jgi:hypothetical protein
LEAVFSNGETPFVERKGHELLMKLFTLPGLPTNFYNSAAARALSVTLQTVSLHNPTVMIKSFVDAINALVKELDSILPWKEGNCLLKSIDGNSQNSLPKTNFQPILALPVFSTQSIILPVY